MSRPKKSSNERRDIIVKVRLTKEEKEMLDKICKKYDATMANIFRNSIYEHWNVIRTTGKLRA